MNEQAIVLFLVVYLFLPGAVFTVLSAAYFAAQHRVRPLLQRVLLSASVAALASLVSAIIKSSTEGVQVSPDLLGIISFLLVQFALTGIPIGLIASRFFDKMFDRPLT